MADRHSCHTQSGFFLVVIPLLESTIWLSNCKHNEFTLKSVFLLQFIVSAWCVAVCEWKRKWAKHLRERSCTRTHRHPAPPPPHHKIGFITSQLLRQAAAKGTSSIGITARTPDLVATPMAEQVRQCQHPASLVPRNPILREKGVGPRHRREVQPTPGAHANTTPGLVATFPAGSRGSGSKPRARPASAASEGEAGLEPVQQAFFAAMYSKILWEN